MAVTTFAAIDISSYEISMKIFEFSRKGGFRTVDDIRYRLNLGVGVYSGGTMEVDKVDTICEVLGDFKRIMAEYGVKEYRACTTSVFREMKNPIIIIEQIYRRRRGFKQCGTAFPWLQIYCSHRKRLQENDPERNCHPGCRRRKPADFPV